jgi:hypothetical protein
MALKDAIVLLGAGASADAGVPMSRAMTQAIVESIAHSRRNARAAAALNYVCAALMAYDAQQSGTSPFGGVDVERVFAAVQMLQERQHDLEIAPFVASWQPAVDGLDQRQPRRLGAFDKKLKAALEPKFPASKAENLIKRLIADETSQAGSGITYEHLASLMIRELRKKIQTTPKQVGYLLPLVEHGRPPGGLTVATLNYDRSVEIACEAAEIACSTGIERWLEKGDWPWPDQGVRLLKLHGSIDWAWKKDQHPSQLPRDRIVVADDPTDPNRPALVFGRRAKLQARGPFLGLLAEFERELARSRRLIVIGYSFRDDHVNEVIRRWISDDFTRTIVVADPRWRVEPGLPSGVSEDFRVEMETHLKQGDTPRLEIWHMGCPEAVRRLGKRGVSGSTSAFTKAEASARLGRGRPRLLLPVADPPERQSAAEFSAGDKGEALETGGRRLLAVGCGARDRERPCRPESGDRGVSRAQV